jgi:hypothetical protein
LSLTTAVRSTFLLQASLLFTPILSTFAGIVVGGCGLARLTLGQLMSSACLILLLLLLLALFLVLVPKLALPPSACCGPCVRHCRPVWMGSMLALAGTAIITRDDSGSAVAAAGASSSVGGLAAGDAVALLSALCYSFATVRLPVWVVRHRVKPLHLAIGKSAFLLVVGLVAAALQLANSGQSLLALWPGWQQPRGWAIMLYAALGPGALASVLHVKVSRGVCLGVPVFADLSVCCLLGLSLPSGFQVNNALCLRFACALFDSFSMTRLSPRLIRSGCPKWQLLSGISCPCNLL